MKKHIIYLIVILLLLALFTHAKTKTLDLDTIHRKDKTPRVYFELHGGYGFPLEGHDIVEDAYLSISGNKTYSLGTGVNFGILGGYRITKNLGFELGINNKLPSSANSIHTATWSDGNSTENEYYVFTMKSGNLIELTPSIRINTGKRKIRPYIVAGLILGLFPSATLEYNLSASNTSNNVGNPSSTFITIEKWTYTGSKTIGMNGTFGVVYMANDRIGIYINCFINGMLWTPSKSMPTEYSVNGINQLPPVNIISTNYLQNNQTNMQCSSVGGNIGLQFRFK